MPLKLFDRRRICLSAHLRPNEQVTALSGFGTTIVVGTGHGCLVIFDASNTSLPNWQEEAKLMLSEARDCKTSIQQICCASAIGLILAVFGEQLFGLVLGDELTTEKIFNQTRRIALNAHPSTGNPFSVQIALAHSQKTLILVGRLEVSEDGEIDFRKDHKLSAPAGDRPVELCYSGRCVCYATEAAAYFVHNLTDYKGAGAPIRLFDATSASVPRVISAVGTEEFSLAGIQGLIMFANGQGASTRPPISLPGQDAIAGLALKEPFLYMLDTSGMLFIFSTIDDQLKQCLDFPDDDDGTTPTMAHSHRKSHRLANIDGQLFVLPSSGDCLYELHPLAILTQIQEHIQLGQLDTALAMLEENYEQFWPTASEQEILQLRQEQQRLGFLFLQNGGENSEEKALDLLVRGETDPRSILSMVAQQHAELQLEQAIGEEATLPKADIPLAMAKTFFERIYARGWADVHIELVEDALTRIYTLLDEFALIEQRLVKTGNNAWNNRAFRQWLVTRDRSRLNDSAVLAAKAGYLEEAFGFWRQMADKGELGRDRQLDACLHTLKNVKSLDILDDALPWLVPLDPNTCMEAIEHFESQNYTTVPPELVLRLFEGTEDLLLPYLEKRAQSLESAAIHDKLLAIYIRLLCQSPNDSKTKQKLRHFLLFSQNYDRQKAQQLFAQQNGHFSVESLLTKAKDPQSAVDSLRELTQNIEADPQIAREENMATAELLCSRFPTPAMFKQMLTLRLRLSKADPAQRTHIPRILCLLDNEAEAIEVLQSLPEDLGSAPVLRNFLQRHFASRLNASRWQQMHNSLASLEGQRLERELSQRRAHNHFRLDEHSTCAICGRNMVAGEQFVWSPGGQLTHLRCQQARQKRVL